VRYGAKFLMVTTPHARPLASECRHRREEAPETDLQRVNGIYGWPRHVGKPQGPHAADVREIALDTAGT